ncbi:hypothetical protein MCOR25_000199 [Pyricularia grisea]|nr:hypothetical protein MCOR25_000199 [Pyricularia grisea]
MIAAVVFATVLIVFGVDGIRWGMGHDIWDVPLEPNIYPSFLLDNIISSVAFCLATGFAKGSILLFYLRIFPTRRMRYTIWLLFGFTVGYSVASAFVNIFSCDPIEASWRVEYATTGRCINKGHFYYTHATLGILTDIATVVTPLPMLKSLHLPVKQRIGAGLVLTVGAFVCIISIVRFKSLFVLNENNNLSRSAQAGDTKPALLWCNLELNLSIIGGNFPTLRPFSQSIFPRLRDTTNSACGWRSKYSERREARLRGFDPGTSIRIDLGLATPETLNGTATAASSPHRDRADGGSGERILLADREQQQDERQPRQPQGDDAVASGPREKKDTRGITKTEESGCKESSKPAQSEP